MRSDPIRGKTVRCSYEDGPTAGTRFEHTFAPDGTVMLDLDAGTVVSFASNEKQLFVQHGTFEFAERVT